MNKTQPNISSNHLLKEKISPKVLLNRDGLCPLSPTHTDGREINHETNIESDIGITELWDSRDEEGSNQKIDIIWNVIQCVDGSGRRKKELLLLCGSGECRRVVCSSECSDW